MKKIQIKRGTRAQIDAAAAASGLVTGEPYLITDEARLAVATAANAYQGALKQNETIPVANGGTGLTSPGASGNVLTSNGTAWVSQAAAASSQDYGLITGTVDSSYDYGALA